MPLTVRFQRLGGPEVLRLEDLEPQQPGPGEVRVRVQAIGLNRAEVNFRRGTYIEQPRSFPAVLGYEAAGVVDAAGPQVETVRPGQPVNVVPAFSQNRYGVYGELAVVPANAVLARPNGLDPVVSAAAWMQYLTGYGALIERGGMGTGHTVVITAAASSVGVAAIQLSRLVGARPLAVVRSADRRTELLAAGAARVIVPGEEDLASAVLAETDGRGAEFVLDAVAGPGVRELARATAPSGTIVVHGTLSGEPTPFPGAETMQALTMRSYTVFETTKDPHRLRAAAGFLTPALASGRLCPLIDRTFNLAQIVAAHTYLETEARLGKVVVTVGR
ncbi:zinc-dependent alcohol dehydrogenase family protein [Streptomyces sp. NPDC001165]|uniref:zinc-dependent alcohol dehydrogenase family protein n=1 Tax=Streptomyces sp. NPDC001165 TaxID=3364546 RepID=UPI0036BBC8C6